MMKYHYGKQLKIYYSVGSIHVIIFTLTFVVHNGKKLTRDFHKRFVAITCAQSSIRGLFFISNQHVQINESEKIEE